jgi:hypothetical protein
VEKFASGYFFFTAGTPENLGFKVLVHVAAISSLQQLSGHCRNGLCNT